MAKINATLGAKGLMVGNLLHVKCVTVNLQEVLAEKLKKKKTFFSLRRLELSKKINFQSRISRKNPFHIQFSFLQLLCQKKKKKKMVLASY